MCWLLEWSVVFGFSFYDSDGGDDDNDDITDDYLQLGLLGTFKQIIIVFF